MLLGRTLFLTENLIGRRYPIEVNLNFVHIYFVNRFDCSTFFGDL